MVVFSDSGFADEGVAGSTDYATFRDMRETLMGSVRAQLQAQLDEIARRRAEHAATIKQRAEQVVGSSGLSWFDRQVLMRQIDADNRAVTTRLAEQHDVGEQSARVAGCRVGQARLHACRARVGSGANGRGRPRRRRSDDFSRPVDCGGAGRAAHAPR